MRNQAPSFNQLAAMARAGDPRAQYALSAAQSARGNNAEARYWLEQAAAQDFPDAVFTLSAALLTGASGATLDPVRGREGVARAAELGAAPALRLQAALLAHDGGDAGAAFGWLKRACAAHDAAALTQAAVLLFALDTEDEDASAMLHLAARSDAAAAVISIRRVNLGRERADAAAAQNLYGQLRKAGYPIPPHIAEPAPGAAASADAGAIADGAPDIERAFEKLRGFSWPAPADAMRVCASPRLDRIEAAFAPEICEYLVAAAQPKLERGAVSMGDGPAGAVHAHRTAWCGTFHLGSTDLAVTLAARRLAELAQISFAQAEPVNVIRYRVGEEYRPHHDFLGPGEEDLRRRGQRVRTALIYLNDGYGGGETHFLSPGVKIAGRTGDVVTFDNVDAGGAPDVSARHASLPIDAGEKWLASVWYRDRAYTP
ncbi:MAG: 2OG-Fe(II) oxygenase [Parvularculaceae bacterium]|nr:2OG-Fe(II) oxygenase [Parvularculaceae bacterium]